MTSRPYPTIYYEHNNTQYPMAQPYQSPQQYKPQQPLTAQYMHPYMPHQPFMYATQYPHYVAPPCPPHYATMHPPPVPTAASSPSHTTNVQNEIKHLMYIRGLPGQRDLTYEDFYSSYIATYASPNQFNLHNQLMNEDSDYFTFMKMPTNASTTVASRIGLSDISNQQTNALVSSQSFVVPQSLVSNQHVAATHQPRSIPRRMVSPPVSTVHTDTDTTSDASSTRIRKTAKYLECRHSAACNAHGELCVPHETFSATDSSALLKHHLAVNSGFHTTCNWLTCDVYADHHCKILHTMAKLIASFIGGQPPAFTDRISYHMYILQHCTAVNDWHKKTYKADRMKFGRFLKSFASPNSAVVTEDDAKFLQFLQTNECLINGVYDIAKSCTNTLFNNFFESRLTDRLCGERTDDNSQLWRTVRKSLPSNCETIVHSICYIANGCETGLHRRKRSSTKSNKTKQYVKQHTVTPPTSIDTTDTTDTDVLNTTVSRNIEPVAVLTTGTQSDSQLTDTLTGSANLVSPTLSSLNSITSYAELVEEVNDINLSNNTQLSTAQTITNLNSTNWNTHTAVKQHAAENLC